MKHAYLIIAHNEFEVLKRLISALDHEANDIYVHIDAKVKAFPQLYCTKSRLYMLTKRVDVRWGDVSQLHSEYALWEEAYAHGSYAYYHLVSGTHLPLKSQQEIRGYFDSVKGSSVLSPMYTNEYEIDLKIRQYNLFTHTFNSTNNVVKAFSQFFWRVSRRMQKILGIKRYKRQTFCKASNWVSLTQEAVEYMLSKKNDILKKYRYTWCGDEFFVPSELSQSYLRDKIVYVDNILRTDFAGSTPRVYAAADYDMLVSSDCLFARKFSDRELEVVDRLMEHINK